MPRLRKRHAAMGVLLALVVGASLIFTQTSLASQVMGRSSSASQWQQDGLPGATVHSITIGHAHPDRVFAGTEDGVYGRDRSGSWHQMLSDQSVWSVAMAADDRTIAAGDVAGDVLVSRDGGAHWRKSQVNVLGVYAVTFQPGSTTSLLAGAGGGLYTSRDAGRSWQRRLDLPHSAGAAFAWFPGHSNTVVAGTVADAPSGSTDVYASKNAGRSWRVVGRDLKSQTGIMSLAVAEPDQILAGTMGNATWKLTSLNGRWQQIAAGMPARNDHVAAIASVPGARSRVFVGTLSDGVFASTGGGKWHNVSAGLPGSDGDRIVLSLEYSPRHLLYAGTPDGVYRLATRAPSTTG